MTPVYLPIGMVAAKTRTGSIVHLTRSAGPRGYCLCGKVFMSLSQVSRRRADVSCDACQRAFKTIEEGTTA